MAILRVYQFRNLRKESPPNVIKTVPRRLVSDKLISISEQSHVNVTNR